MIVTKLDRLGRDAIDVSSTVRALAEMGVRVNCLALGEADLASSGSVDCALSLRRDMAEQQTMCHVWSSEEYCSPPLLKFRRA
ncbi:resolvase-like protein [Phyllobacterium brassicacearum]|nr:resolvase-like protein [Phyllobacterium brassicacearum]